MSETESSDTHVKECPYCGADVTVSPGDNQCVCGATVMRTTPAKGRWHGDWRPPA